tara:strand:+ start:536 stop:739 length:204 start_codon:yes stop_codon:yes gene_type:complete
MNETELGILFGGISSILGVLIYFTKNIKESSCCGNKCKQVVVDSHGDVIRTSTIDLEAQTFPKTATI